MNARTPAIANSGYRGQNVDDRERADAFDRLLTKPIAIERLVEPIRTLCSWQRATE